jgi:hypothetical protein
MIGQKIKIIINDTAMLASTFTDAKKNSNKKVYSIFNSNSKQINNQSM